METLGSYLKARRGTRSQREIADGAGIGQSYLALLEADTRIPSSDVLHRLCEQLSMTPDERSEALRMAGDQARSRRAGDAA